MNPWASVDRDHVQNSLDTLGRLVQEDYDAPGTPVDFVADYVYDLVGNRMEMRIDTDGNGTIDDAIAYLYDENDPLLTESLDLGDDRQVERTTGYEYGVAENLGVLRDRRVPGEGPAVRALPISRTSEHRISGWTL